MHATWKNENLKFKINLNSRRINFDRFFVFWVFRPQILQIKLASQAFLFSSTKSFFSFFTNYHQMLWRLYLKGMAEIRRLAETHFKKRDEDDAEFKELEERMQKAKEVLLSSSLLNFVVLHFHIFQHSSNDRIYCGGFFFRVFFVAGLLTGFFRFTGYPIRQKRFVPSCIKTFTSTIVWKIFKSVHPTPRKTPATYGSAEKKPRLCKIFFSNLQGGAISRKSPNKTNAISCTNYIVGVINDVIFKIEFPKFTLLNFYLIGLGGEVHSTYFGGSIHSILL
jgi:hypothetical protein